MDDAAAAALFEQTCLPCPICKLRFHRGAAIWIAARLCVVCKHCQYHCRCGPAQQLRTLEPIEGIPPEADEPVVVDGAEARAAEDSVEGGQILGGVWEVTTCSRAGRLRAGFDPKSLEIALKPWKLALKLRQSGRRKC